MFKNVLRQTFSLKECDEVLAKKNLKKGNATGNQ